ncbi:MAG: peroxiredoxin [Bacteroidales bacterium]|nr:peroxiredoxin [Bacteroidales bacterium]
MKTKILLIMVLFLSTSQLWAQDNSNVRIPLIGESAPSFTAQSTNGEISFPADYGSKWKILFSHPRDFTPVCSSELLEMAYLQNDFDKMGVKLVVVSTDTLYQHVAWKKTLEEINYKNREKVKIKFAIVDDQSWSIAKKYGMLHPKESTTSDVRGVYIIDPDDKIQAIFFYPMNIGRNFDEIKRTIAALQSTYKNKLLTSADWKPGDDFMVPYQKTNDGGDLTKNKSDYYQVSWFMTFLKSKGISEK